MKKLCSLLFLISLFIFAGCTTAPKTPSEEPTQPIPSPSQTHKRFLSPAEIEQLSQYLKMERPIEDIGYQEKTFNDCSIPREFRLDENCSTQYLTLIHFRMRCRESEGTVESVSHMELSPLVSNSIKWNIGRLKGKTSTDGRGYGTVRTISKSSIRNQSIRLTANGQIMSVRVNEVRQFVLPRYWCN